MKTFRSFSLVVLTVVVMIAGCGKAKVVTPEVAQMQNQLKNVQRGDLIFTADDRIYLVDVNSDADGSFVSVQECIDCNHSIFYADLLVERKAIIIHRGDEHYGPFLEQFIQRIAPYDR